MNELEKLFKELSKCDKCLDMRNKKQRDCSLINIYKDKNFCTKIPSIWTDWQNRLESNIMIIGQDWGPFLEMQKLNKLYVENETLDNWHFLIEQEKSLTKRNLEKFLFISAKENGVILKRNLLDDFYITNAILCARQGENYRGDNIVVKKCTLNCSQFLKRQIDIVKPKIILTLGFYPLLALSTIYNFKIQNNLANTINEYGEFKIDEDIKIIPIYHPASQIKQEIQINQYNKISAIKSEKK